MVNDGEWCGKRQDVYLNCNRDTSFCHYNKCIKKRGKDMGCNNNNQCKSGFYCDDSKCQKLKGKGEDCDINDQCRSGFYCKKYNDRKTGQLLKKECQDKVAAGNKCKEDSACLNNKCVMANPEDCVNSHGTPFHTSDQEYWDYGCEQRICQKNAPPGSKQKRGRATAKQTSSAQALSEPGSSSQFDTMSGLVKTQLTESSALMKGGQDLISQYMQEGAEINFKNKELLMEEEKEIRNQRNRNHRYPDDQRYQLSQKCFDLESHEAFIACMNRMKSMESKYKSIPDYRNKGGKPRY